ncbi:MAG: ABC transporter transmembrane domain-containing protein [Eubacteriales bacterium]
MIKEFLKKYGYLYIPGLIFLALNSYIQSLAPDALGKAIDLLAAPSPSRDAVLRQAGIIALIGVGIRGALHLAAFHNRQRAEDGDIPARKLYLKLQAMPVNYPEPQLRRPDGVRDNDVGAVRITFGPVLAQSVNGIVIALLSIFGMARETDLGVTLLALAPVPFAAAATIILGGKVQQRFGKVQKLFSGLSGFVNESIAGIKVTKAFAKEDVREAEFGEISGKMRDANVSLVNASSLISPAVTVSFGVLRARADFRRRGGGSRKNGRRLARQLPRLPDARPTADSPARHDNQPCTARSRELQAPEGGLRRAVGPVLRPGAQRERRARTCPVG